MMVRNLEERGCALQGIHTYDSAEAQAARYKEAGLAAVEVMDMDSVYNYFLDKTELHRYHPSTTITTPPRLPPHLVASSGWRCLTN